MPITHLFLDIGGVMLSNGWDHVARARASAYFKIDAVQLETQHRLVFEAYEQGKFSLEEYLKLVIFTQKRAFSEAEFREFMFAQSTPIPKMLKLFQELKKKHALKIAVVNNEARELNAYRIQKFKLHQFVDFFISSGHVHLRKPDPEIFRLALDISQVDAKQVLYIENTPLFVQIAENLGIRSILHKNFATTNKQLSHLQM